MVPMMLIAQTGTEVAAARLVCAAFVLQDDYASTVLAALILFSSRTICRTFVISFLEGRVGIKFFRLD